MIVEIIPAAEAEFEEAVAYYNAQRLGLGNAFAAEVDAAIQRIIDYPHAWQRVATSARRCLLQRFDYGIVYQVRGDVVTIYAVMHLKRRPNYWRNR